MTSPFGHYLTRDLIVHLVFFQAVVLAIVLSNLWIARRPRRHPAPSVWPLVSVLVPVRNEEANIAACLDSLLSQDYPEFELLVLDDGSTDGTRPILDRLAAGNVRLRVLTGTPPSGDLLGKNWACAQLARQARGVLLFFTDADTLHRPDMLRAIVTALEGERADLLSGFPHQELRTWGERLLVPFFSWALLSFNPLALAYRIRLPVLSSAVGQMMLFRHEAYQAIGGHERVSASIVDDLSLARAMKAAGLRWRMTRVADLITCRMYRSSREAYEGFTKNLFAAFEFRLLPYLAVFIWLAVMFLWPWIVTLLGLTGLAEPPSIALAACFALAVLLWLAPYADLGIPLGLALLYPLTILANLAVAARSLGHSLGGRLTWKGRAIARPKWKWL